MAFHLIVAIAANTFKQTFFTKVIHMIDLFSAYICFWSNVIASSIFVFECCYFYFHTHLLYKFTTFAATKWLIWQYGVILLKIVLPFCFR